MLATHTKRMTYAGKHGLVAWPEGRRLRAFKFVLPGMHTIECRGPSGLLPSRGLEVAIGRDTPVFWGP